MDKADTVTVFDLSAWSWGRKNGFGFGLDGLLLDWWLWVDVLGFVAIDLVYNFLLRFITVWIFLSWDLCDLKGLVFKRCTTIVLLGFYNFEQSYIFGELRDIISLEFEFDWILRTRYFILSITYFTHECINATFAEGVSAWGQQARKIVSVEFVGAELALQLAQHY